MATMEDRLLGEKLHYYCSSSESEGEEEDEGKCEEDDFDVEKSKQAQADKIAEKAYLQVCGQCRYHYLGCIFVRRQNKSPWNQKLS